MQLKVINGGQHPCPGRVKTITLQPKKTTLLDELIEDLKTIYYRGDIVLKSQAFGIIRAGASETEGRRLRHERK